jgi:hypothetical protein
LIGTGLVELYVDIFVQNNFDANNVQPILAGLVWAFIGNLLKDVDWFSDSVPTEWSPLFNDKEIHEFKLLFGGSGLIFFAGMLSSPWGLASGFGGMILGFTAFTFVIMCFVRGTQKGIPYMLDYAQNSIVFPSENLYSIVGPVMLLLTLFLPWSIGTSQGDIIDIETQVEVTFTGSQLFQINSLVMFVVIASVVPIIQYAVKKNEEFPMIPTVCFGIVALCDLLLLNNIRASSVDFDLGEAGSITGNASPGIGLILNLILSALLAFSSFQSQTESGSVQNETSYEEKQESRVPKKVVKEKSSGSLANELNKLNELKERGILDDDEFKAAKAKLLK